MYHDLEKEHGIRSIESRCRGCGVMLPAGTGETHRYMLSSPACWARYGRILAREYEDKRLLSTHRLSVDTYAVQHGGSPSSRQAIQSVGLHLARLMIMLERPLAAEAANDVMLGFGRHKHSLPYLRPPSSPYRMTVGDIPLGGSWQEHAGAVRDWAQVTWMGWEQHHDTIRSWVAAHANCRTATANAIRFPDGGSG